MHIIISGSSGMVGQALVLFLTAQGHRVSRLVRRQSSNADEIYWNPMSADIEQEKLEGADAVVHLAGENIFQKRWTPQRKKEILNSRVDGTRVLCEALAQLNKPPKVIISASAIGYYGNRGDNILTEKSSPGAGFLTDVCQAWEKATALAVDKGIRVVNLRIGIILTTQGGALAQMLTPFKMGVGGTLGTGRQWMSWISIDDLLGAIMHTISTDALNGPVNAVAPNPVTNAEFTKSLGKVLSRPTFFPVPKFGLRILFGEMADEMLLASARVKPEKLLGCGFSFRHSDLAQALEFIYLLSNPTLRASIHRGLATPLEKCTKKLNW